MSIATEVQRITNNVNDSLAAVAEMGVEVPANATSDDLATLIRAIPRAVIVQGTGQSTENLMSQKAVTDLFNSVKPVVITDATVV